MSVVLAPTLAGLVQSWPNSIQIRPSPSKRNEFCHIYSALRRLNAARRQHQPIAGIWTPSPI